MRNFSLHTNYWFRGNKNLLSAGYCSVSPISIEQSKPDKNPGLKYNRSLS